MQAAIQKRRVLSRTLQLGGRDCLVPTAEAEWRIPKPAMEEFWIHTCNSNASWCCRLLLWRHVCLGSTTHCQMIEHNAHVCVQCSLAYTVSALNQASSCEEGSSVHYSRSVVPNRRKLTLCRHKGNSAWMALSSCCQPWLRVFGTLREVIRKLMACQHRSCTVHLLCETEMMPFGIGACQGDHVVSLSLVRQAGAGATQCRPPSSKRSVLRYSRSRLAHS